MAWGDAPSDDRGFRRRARPSRRDSPKVWGATLPKGTISIDTYPMCTNGLRDLGRQTYRMCCEGYGTNIIVDTWLPLADKVEEKIGFASLYHSSVYAPCVINQTRKRFPHHQAALLMPPNFSEKPDLFVPGLVIPEMTVAFALGNGDDPKGYVLTSRLDPSQELFMIGHRKMKKIYQTEGLTLQGMLMDVPENDREGRKRTRPVVRINMDSLDSPEIMAANSAAVDLLLESDKRFWWDLDVCKL
jgi:hypothetical protein